MRPQVYAADEPEDETELFGGTLDPVVRQPFDDARRLQGGNVKSKKTQKLHSLLAGVSTPRR